MINEYGQRLGPALPDWTPPPVPPSVPLRGTYCRVEPLDPGIHSAGLAEALGGTGDDEDWTYLFSGPFATLEEVRAWIASESIREDRLCYAIVSAKDNQPQGVVSYLRIAPEYGSIEIGSVLFAAPLKQTAAATEAIRLLIRNVFDLGYRRCEWKCDSLNIPSKKAARRFGFSFEGLLRNAVVYKGRSRDTSWFAITDGDWVRLEEAYLRWLAPVNFDDQGVQKERLSDLTRPLVRDSVRET